MVRRRCFGAKRLKYRRRSRINSALPPSLIATFWASAALTAAPASCILHRHERVPGTSSGISSKVVARGQRRRKLHDIQGYCRLLARQFRPRKIILFGSYAYGRPTRESDVDLLVIMPHRSRPIRQSVAIRERCAAPFPLDLLVWTPAYARKRRAWNDSFTREVFQQGKVMYEASHP